MTSSKTMHASDHMSAGVEYRACSSTCGRRPPAQRSQAPAGTSPLAARPAARRPPRPPARPPEPALDSRLLLGLLHGGRRGSLRNRQGLLRDNRLLLGLLRGSRQWPHAPGRAAGGCPEQALANAQAATAAAVQQAAQQAELASTSCQLGALLTCSRGATWRAQGIALPHVLLFSSQRAALAAAG